MIEFENKEFYERIDQLIRMKATGNPNELSNKLGISESHLYRIIGKMKEKANCPIEYSKFDNSYVYRSKGRLRVDFFFDSLEDNELSKIKGGKINFVNFASLSKNESRGKYFCIDNLFIN